MTINKHKIGRYHGIIKKTYEDGSVDYETSFTSQADLMSSVYAIGRCVGKIVGTATDNPRVLVDFKPIYGKENIMKELSL